jgi:GNAT superfamily N-acetyltransferase
MFHIRRLAIGELELILELQHRIWATLPDKAVFQLSTSEFIAYCLSAGGRCYAVTHRGEPVAYLMVYFPRAREFNLAKDISLPHTEYDHVAHWDTIAVLPEWRGHGLSRLLHARALADIAETDVRHLLATSSPGNPLGIKTLFTAGFRPIRLVVKFGGKLRLLFYRPQPAAWDPGRDGGARELDLLATDALAKAFEDGWVGSDITIGASGAWLSMRRHALPFGPGDGPKTPPERTATSGQEAP